ncbi:hypothetical protein LCGC14_0030150 [marine sediment metagenome]|uniref:Uncharacterized protein n=1 Tax=marine sediment metagenome TaxID=412755 RepID=A0A0F9VZM0_9ZZZZ|nr:hypothetical protein [Halomonas sp.]HDZ49566.1 hypothetical protein [Halomonas sp.]HEB06451.1 hypothetical protein [Halomonas sp.]
MIVNTKSEKLAVIRKGKRKDPMQDSRSLMQFASESSRTAIRKNLEAGVSVVYERDGYLVEESPDHQVKQLKKLKESPPFNLREYLCQG